MLKSQTCSRFTDLCSTNYCIYDVEDLISVNISISDDAISDNSSGIMDHYDAVTWAKLMEKTINCGEEKYYIRLLLIYSRYFSINGLMRTIWLYWWHIYDHGDLSHLERIIDLVALIPWIMNREIVENSYRLLEKFIKQAEDSIKMIPKEDLEKLRPNLRETLRWLRYEWSVGSDDSLWTDVSKEIKASQVNIKSKRWNRISKLFQRKQDKFVEQVISEPLNVQGPSDYFLQFSVEILASHLCLAQENMYAQIPWRKVLDYAIRDDKKCTDSIVYQAILKTNALTEWAIWTILMPPYSRNNITVPRHVVIEKFFDLAMYLLELNNFDGFIAIILALQHPAISRLVNDWKKTSKSVRRLFDNNSSGGKKTNGNHTDEESESILGLCSPAKNWKQLRQRVNSSLINRSKEFLEITFCSAYESEDLTGESKEKLPLPGINYFGLVCNDLILSEESKQDFIPSPALDSEEPLVNMRKVAFQCDVITGGYCIGCQGIDILGRRVRSSYWNSMFVGKSMSMHPHLYTAFSDLRPAISVMKESMHNHPILRSTGDKGNKSPVDFYSISRLIE